MSNKLQEHLQSCSDGQLRSNIERIIKSYRHTWDVFAELLQNSADALIEQHGEQSLDQGQIRMDIFCDERRIIIKDNGIGIPADSLAKILVTGESLKRANNVGKFGFMGFGLTFVAFQTEYLKIESTHGGEKHSCTYHDLYNTVYSGTAIPQSDEETEGKSPIPTSECPGTTVEVRFPGSFPDSSTENNLCIAFTQAAHEKLFEYILRTRTVVGSLGPLIHGLPNFSFVLQVDGEDREVSSSYLGTEEIARRVLHSERLFYDLCEDRYAQVVAATEGLDQLAQTQARKANHLRGTYTDCTIGSFPSIPVSYYASATSKTHLQTFERTINDGVEERAQLEVGNGVWLSLGGMPTGICLDVLDRLLPYTVIVDVDSQEVRASLDAGRKGLTPYRAGQLIEGAKSILRNESFIAYKQYVVGGSDSRISDPLYDPQAELQRGLELKNSFQVSNTPVWLPPREEQEVIALFAVLCATEKLKGYSIKVLSGFQVYDGLLDYQITGGPDVVRSPDNPLGLLQAEFDQRGNQISVNNRFVEFKKSIHGLINDVNRDRKNAEHIDLLITWEDPLARADDLRESFGVFVNEGPANDNVYYGVTHHAIGLRQRILPIICLERVFSILGWNDSSAQ